MCDKRITGGDRLKPRDPEDKALRKLFVGALNATTNCAAMQRYFEKFREVERCYHVIGKESPKYKGYGFVVFRAVAAADKVRRTRPHTIMGCVQREQGGRCLRREATRRRTGAGSSALQEFIGPGLAHTKTPWTQA